MGGWTFFFPTEIRGQFSCQIKIWEEEEGEGGGGGERKELCCPSGSYHNPQLQLNCYINTVIAIYSKQLITRILKILVEKLILKRVRMSDYVMEDLRI